MIQEQGIRFIDGLLAQMTLQEKIGQLCQRLYGFQIYEWDKEKLLLSDEFMREVEACGGLGTLYGLYRADPWSGRTYENGLTGERAVRTYNTIQKYVLEHSRLSIPVMMSSECPHGHQALDGYILPVNLAVGASFSPEHAGEAALVCARQMKGMGVDLALVSLLDILRDPRWGRSEECFGEDPYLASCMAKAVVEKMQREGIGVVAKHFCGQGETTGGVNASAARIGPRELAEIHLPAAKACCEAEVRGIMAAYNEIDGIYCHANRQLLQDILREEFGFQGAVMADGVAIDQLDTMTGERVRSAAAALNAGVDIGLWDEAFSRLDEAFESGLVSGKTLDQAVRRVLYLKWELGLFDRPYLAMDGTRVAEYSDLPAEETAGIAGSVCTGERRSRCGTEKKRMYTYEDYPQSERLAQESVILLKNKGHLLPLAKEKRKIAVIGPNADDLYRQIGDYSPPLREGVGKTVWQGLVERAREWQQRKTLVGADRGQQTARMGTEKECCQPAFRFSDGANLQQAAETAAWSDVVILALGGSSSRFGAAAVFDKNGAVLGSGKMAMDCGEGVDSADLRLPDGQDALFDTVRRSANALVTVVIAGRPYAIPNIAEQTDALLYAFYPGPVGGAAIADLIYGIRSPMGRLPVSLPRSAGQLPVYYNYKKSYRAMHYCNENEGALYCFGEGFGYGAFSCSNVRITEKEEGFCLTCEVKNEGQWEDAMVLQCYRLVTSSSVVPRVRELKAFQKVYLQPGEEKKVTIPIGREFFQIYAGNGRWEEEKGKYGLLLMDSGKVYWEGVVEGGGSLQDRS